MELIDREKLLKELKISAEHHEENSREYVLMLRDRNIVREQKAIEAVPMEKIDEILDKFSKWLWSEHEDVCGNQMIDIGYAEGYLRELFDWERKWEE